MKNPQEVVPADLYIYIFIKGADLMEYINAKTVLPVSLLNRLQDLVPGKLIYIPEKGLARAGWGEHNGAKERYTSRNREITVLYRSGIRVGEIADRYHLSEYSIRKITKGCKYTKEYKGAMG
jgi:DNA-binding NarL/FixJ family response regulator